MNTQREHSIDLLEQYDYRRKDTLFNLGENRVHCVPKRQKHAQLLFILILTGGGLVQIGLLISTAPTESA